MTAASDAARDLASILARVRETFIGLLLLQIALKSIALIVLAPLAATVLNLLLARSDLQALSNNDIARLLLSWPGAIAVVSLATAWLALWYLEQLAVTALLDGSRPSTFRVLRQALTRLPTLTRLALRQIVIALALLLPIAAAAAGVYWLLLADADINFHLHERPPRFWVALALGAILVLFAIIIVTSLAIRWFVSIPLVLRGLDARSAMRESERITRSARRGVVAAMLLWLATRTAIASALGTCLQWLAGVVIDESDETISRALIFSGLLLAFSIAVLAAASALDRIALAGLAWRMLLRLAPQTRVDSPPFMRTFTLVGMLSILAGLLLVGGLLAVRQASELLHRQRVEIVAHRAGAFLGPENSLAALEASIAAGADEAEIDVQLSSDGTVFVAHDRDLRRIANVPLRVSHATSKQLRDAGAATLDDFLDASRGRIRLSIELKYYGPDPRLVPAVIESIRAKTAKGVSIISLEASSLREVRSIDSTIPVGLVVGAGVGNLLRADVDLLSVNASLLARSVASRGDRQTPTIAAWTLNSPATLRTAMLLGADQVITDDPRMARTEREAFYDLSDAELLLLRLRESLR